MVSMERDYYYPKLASREEPIVWQEAGSMYHWCRAKAKVQELLQHQPSYLDPEIDLKYVKIFLYYWLSLGWLCPMLLMRHGAMAPKHPRPCYAR
jgi:hypothetical protein